MAKRQKLNSMRLLESRSIPYRIYRYDTAERDARGVAAAVGLPEAMVYKTLVTKAPTGKKPVLVLLPCHTSLNLKRLAKALGIKKTALAPHAAAEKLTGLRVGGISALALTQKRWRILLDARAADLPEIVISAGQRGLQIRLETAALIKLLGCEMADVADEMAD